VIEYRRGPCDCVVTRGTVRCCKRGSRRRVRRIIRRLPGCQVALRIPAVRRRNRQAVVVVDVASGARYNFAGGRQLVRICQRKPRGRMVES